LVQQADIYSLFFIHRVAKAQIIGYLIVL